MLILYRLGVHIPTPGVDGGALQQVFAEMQGTIFSWFNVFSGGALERFSIFALGVMPYISSSIIFQLLTVVIPSLAEVQKQGETGRRTISQYTRYGTVVLALIQGYAIAVGLERYSTPQVVLDPGLHFRIFTALTLCGGTLFLMWVGEQMTERGIGNGISLLIFAGIVARLPSGVASMWGLIKTGELSLFKFILIGVGILLVFLGIVFVEKSSRKVPIEYAKRVVGRRIYSGQSSHIPLKINTSGVIPPIFASSLMMFPATIGTFVASGILSSVAGFLAPGELLHEVLFVALIFFFCFFYTAVAFRTDEISENLKKNGAFVPGVRPGQNTASYLDFVLARLTVGGAAYIALICLLPQIVNQVAKVPIYFGGTSLLIMVGVATDLVSQVETYLLSREYDGFLKYTRLPAKRDFSLDAGN
jgi:preprotein translocase subunit SecY